MLQKSSSTILSSVRISFHSFPFPSSIFPLYFSGAKFFFFSTRSIAYLVIFYSNVGRGRESSLETISISSFLVSVSIVVSRSRIDRFYLLKNTHCYSTASLLCFSLSLLFFSLSFLSFSLPPSSSRC